MARRAAALGRARGYSFEPRRPCGDAIALGERPGPEYLRPRAPGDRRGMRHMTRDKAKKIFRSVMRLTLCSFGDEFNSRPSRDRGGRTHIKRRQAWTSGLGSSAAGRDGTG